MNGSVLSKLLKNGADDGIKLYHGTAKGNDFDIFDLNRANTGVGSNVIDQGNQIYLTESPEAAQYFARLANDKSILRNGTIEDLSRTGQPGDVLEFGLSPSARILDVDDMPRGNADQILNKARDDGYHAVRFNDRGFDTIEGDNLAASAYRNGKPPRTVIPLYQDILERLR